MNLKAIELTQNPSYLVLKKESKISPFEIKPLEKGLLYLETLGKNEWEWIASQIIQNTHKAKSLLWIPTYLDPEQFMPNHPQNSQTLQRNINDMLERDLLHYITTIYPSGHSTEPQNTYTITSKTALKILEKYPAFIQAF